MGLGRELGTENLTVYPISFSTSFSHGISLKLEFSSFSFPPFATVILHFICIFFLLYWMKMESSPFSFPPF